MKLKFSFINLDEDKPLIDDWEKQYSETDGFKAITKYVLENKLYYNLAEVLSVNFEKVRIGDDEFRNIIVAKTRKNDIAGFALYNAFSLNDKPEVAIIYIAIHPMMQKKGVGTAMLTEMFENPQKYFNCTPTKISTLIDITNNASKKLFRNFGLKMTARQFSNEELYLFENTFENILDHMSQQGKTK